MRACLDASVLVSIVFGDAGSDRLMAWLDRIEEPPLVSDLCLGEFVAVVGRKVRSRELDEATAQMAIEGVEALAMGWERVALHPDHVLAATDLMRDFALGLRLPDALHLAIDHRCAATLVTTDRIQGRAARALGLSIHNPLEDPA